MTLYEWGKENREVIVLIHPSLVRWDYFDYVVPLLEDSYHLIVPALPGYDPDREGDFTSVEEVADELARDLLSLGVHKIACLYGCSMGGSVVARFLAEGRVPCESACLDGGITPYQLPYLLTRLIAIRDFCMVGLGKLGGIGLLEKAFSTDEYSKEDLAYVAEVLGSLSARTIYRTFESCNNYRMPQKVRPACGRIEYWVAEAEKKARSWDLAYMKKTFPDVHIREFAGTGHAGLAALQPALLAEELRRLCREGSLASPRKREGHDKD